MVKIAWNKGRTKFDHPSLQRIAIIRKRHNNFTSWYKKNKPNLAAIRKSGDLAELYGTILGDGCIEKFPRTEKLVVSFNANETAHIKHVASLIDRVFQKFPSIRKRTTSHCTDVYFYQQKISKRLKFPTGRKLNYVLVIPRWIKNNPNFLIRCLKGLFATDGDWVIDRKYKTNVIKFTNVSRSLLDDVYDCLKKLGFHPRKQTKNTRLAKNDEVYRFVNLIKFRQY